MAKGRRTTILLGLLAAACGLAGGQSVRPAGQTMDQHGEVPASGVTQAEPRVAATKKAPPLDLTQFRPLLADPKYRGVREKLEAGEADEASTQLGKLIEANQGVAELDDVRRHYLLGVLRRMNGDSAGAEKAFGKAAQSAWVLRDDALLNRAELEAARGDAKSALLSLRGLQRLASDPRAMRTQADALATDGQYEKAVEIFRDLVADDSPSSRLALAEALLQVAEAAPQGSRRKTLSTEASQQAQLARLGLLPDAPLAKRAAVLEARSLASGASSAGSLGISAQLVHLRGLVDLRDFEEAEKVAQGIQIPKDPPHSRERCEHDYLFGKVMAGLRRWGEGADKVRSSADGCGAFPEMHAWLLFNSGKYNAADGRHTQAIRHYGEVERLYAENSLADDSRLRAARSYKRAGAPAKFVSFLSSLVDDYPDGDMTMEGVLELALYRIERSDWSAAAQVLERAAKVIRSRDSARGHEYAGTERYFLARAQQELGEEETALLEYESIVREVPLSYYMLHSYSRLLEADPKRAKAALDAGLRQAQEAPFSFPHRPEYETTDFLRGMELLRVGDTERGKEVLSAIGLTQDAEDSLLWGIALLYDRAGDAHTSHNIARGRLSDWLAYYPEGSWGGAWEIGFPRPYLEIVEKESLATGVPEWFIYGVMREESTFRPRVVSHANAYGLMQVIIPTARGIGKRSGHPYSAEALKRPDVNIAIGSRVLRELARRFRANPWLAIPGYNAGPGNPSKWLHARPNVDFDVWVEMIPYRETRRYTKRVLASRAAYAFLYYREASQTALVLPKRLTIP